MKLITSLVVMAGLYVGVASVGAQDEETASPSPTSEETAAPAMETPPAAAESSPIAMPEQKATPAAMPSSEKKEQSAASSTSGTDKKKAATADNATKPTATKAAASVADTGSAESNVKRLENEWEISLMKHDPSFAQERIAEDHMGWSSKGKRVNKAGLIKQIKSDNDTYTSAKNGNVTVRSYGPNIAIATGTSKEVGKGKDGKAFSRSYVWTDTWMLRGKKWQCVGSQAMLVSGK